MTKPARKLVEVYKSSRHLLVQDFHPLTPHPKGPEERDVVEFRARDGSGAVVLAFRACGGPELVIVPLKGLVEGGDL